MVELLSLPFLGKLGKFNSLEECPNHTIFNFTKEKEAVALLFLED